MLIYDLYATVNHYGNVYLGHYTASIKSPVGDSKGMCVFNTVCSAKLIGVTFYSTMPTSIKRINNSHCTYII